MCIAVTKMVMIQSLSCSVVVGRMMCFWGCFIWSSMRFSWRCHFIEMLLNQSWQRTVFIDKNKRRKELERGFLVIHLLYCSKCWRKDSFWVFACVFNIPSQTMICDNCLLCEIHTHTHRREISCENARKQQGECLKQTLFWISIVIILENNTYFTRWSFWCLKWFGRIKERKTKTQETCQSGRKRHSQL